MNHDLHAEYSGDVGTTVAQLRELVQRFVDEREWNQFHNPKNLTMSLAIEVGELMEHFQWLTTDESLRVADDTSAHGEIGEEIADCLAYLLALANTLSLDLSDALSRKMVKNAKKYPVSSSRGVAKPNPLTEDLS